MKLKITSDDAVQDGIHIRDLHELLGQPGYSVVRPCSGCTKKCACCESLSCTRSCGPHCAHAPVAMSTDGEKYPIEERIAPLVFYFNCLRVCEPYWSCEGHQFSTDGPIKVPQVWFHSRSLMYPKLIAEYLVRLKIRNSVQNSWLVCLTFTEENLEAGFSIKPDMTVTDKPTLKSLQQDIETIANSLVDGVRAIATEYIRRYESRNAGPGSE